MIQILWPSHNILFLLSIIVVTCFWFLYLFNQNRCLHRFGILFPKLICPTVRNLQGELEIVSTLLLDPCITFIKFRKSQNDFFKPTFPPKKRMNEFYLLLWNLRWTCFCSFFGGNWRPQKDASKSSDLYYQNEIFYPKSSWTPVTSPSDLKQRGSKIEKKVFFGNKFSLWQVNGTKGFHCSTMIKHI